MENNFGFSPEGFKNLEKRLKEAVENLVPNNQYSNYLKYPAGVEIDPHNPNNLIICYWDLPVEYDGKDYKVDYDYNVDIDDVIEDFMNDLGYLQHKNVLPSELFIIDDDGYYIDYVDEAAAADYIKKNFENVVIKSCPEFIGYIAKMHGDSAQEAARNAFEPDYSRYENDYFDDEY